MKPLSGLKTLKPGDEVVFRCGGTAVVSVCYRDDGYQFVKYMGDSRTYYYKPDGERVSQSPSVLDIIKINKAAKRGKK